MAVVKNRGILGVTRGFPTIHGFGPSRPSAPNTSIRSDPPPIPEADPVGNASIAAGCRPRSGWARGAGSGRGARCAGARPGVGRGRYLVGGLDDGRKRGPDADRKAAAEPRTLRFGFPCRLQMPGRPGASRHAWRTIEIEKARRTYAGPETTQGLSRISSCTSLQTLGKPMQASARSRQRQCLHLLGYR